MPGREVFLATCVALCVLCGSKVSVDARKTNYVLPNKVVPESHANTYVTVQTTCACKFLCTTHRCKTYSVTKTTPINITCSVSVAHVNISSLLDEDGDSYTVYKSRFTLVETNYYKIRGKQTYFEARDLCLSEGGRLAVGYTGQMLAEIQKFMQASNIVDAWVGLFSEVVSTEPLQIQTPAWNLQNGTYIDELQAVPYQSNRCFQLNFELGLSANSFLTSVESCDQRNKFICQRNY